jgi:hypothetical protein
MATSGNEPTKPTGKGEKKEEKESKEIVEKKVSEFGEEKLEVKKLLEELVKRVPEKQKELEQILGTKIEKPINLQPKEVVSRQMIVENTPAPKAISDESFVVSSNIARHKKKEEDDFSRTPIKSYTFEQLKEGNQKKKEKESNEDVLKGIKLKFEGHDVFKFLSEYNIIVKTYNLSEQAKIILLGRAIGGAATSVMNELLNKEGISSEEIITTLMQRFSGGETTGEEALAEWLQCHQKTNESLAEFFNRCDNILLRVQTRFKPSEEMKKLKLASSVKEELKIVFLNHSSKSINDIIEELYREERAWNIRMAAIGDAMKSKQISAMEEKEEENDTINAMNRTPNNIVYCKKCKQKNHYEKDCKLDWNPKISCHNCNEPNHLKKNCTKYSRGRRNFKSGKGRGGW